jgi:hypothetical protein
MSVAYTGVTKSNVRILPEAQSFDEKACGIYLKVSLLSLNSTVKSVT